MKPPSQSLLTGALALTLVFFGTCGPALAQQGVRLDPAERERLRGELRLHAWEDRMRAREAWRAGRGLPATPPPYGYERPPPAYLPAPQPVQPVPGYAQPAPGYPQPPPGYAQPAPGYGQPAPGYPRAGAVYPPGYGQPPAGYVSPGPSYGYLHPPAGPRLTPEEREQLRLQLRDARRHQFMPRNN